MIIYWAGCLASMVAASLCQKKSLTETHRWLAVLISALPMIMIASLRYDVGEDYLFTYVPYFESIRDSIGGTRMEPLYHFLNVVVAWLHGGYVWVFAIIAILFYFAVFGYILRESPYPVLSIFLIVGMGYCFVFFNAMRQMAGCAILLLALECIKRRKFFSFLLCVIMAAGFHISCILFLPMYWIGRVRIRPTATFILIAIIVILSGPIAELMRFIVSRTQYSIYLLSVFDTGETAYVMLALNVALLIFMSVGYRDDEGYQLFYNMQILALGITLFSGKVVLILRLLWMFGLPSIVSLPVAISNLSMSERDKKMAISMIMILYFAYATYTVGVQNSNHVLPYKTIFSRWIS